MRIWPGRPYPLGAALGWHRRQLRSLRSARHQGGTLPFRFPRSHARNIVSPCPNKPTWSGTVFFPMPSRDNSTGIRVHGPYDPKNGHRFNPNKIVLDPYAKAIGRDLKWDDSLFGYKVGDPAGDLSFDDRDNAAVCPARRGSGHGLHLGRRPPPQDALAQNSDLRSARPRSHHEASGGHRGTPRDLRRSRF